MTILTYNGQNIEQRDIDGYLNATQMASVEGKKINDWTRTSDYIRYVEATSAITGIPANELVVSKQGQPANGGGTWIHPKLAIKLARWISVDFEIWCDEHIRTLIETGSTSLTDHRLDPQWQQLRKEGKKGRLNLTDEVKAYIARHPELSPKEIHWIYAQHSDALNTGLYNRTSKQLKKILNIGNKALRNYFSEEEIGAIKNIEDIAAWFIYSMDMHPVTAINEVIKLTQHSARFARLHNEPTALTGSGKAKKPKSLPPDPDNGQLSLLSLLN